jgi:hypothetical protein
VIWDWISGGNLQFPLAPPLTCRSPFLYLLAKACRPEGSSHRRMLTMSFTLPSTCVPPSSGESRGQMTREPWDDVKAASCAIIKDLLYF